MLFKYSVDHNDYLSYLFYSASKSKKAQKRRAMNKLVLMIIYVLTGLMLYSRNGPVASAAFFLLCLPLYFLYNVFEKKQYHKHFNRFINTHFKDRIGKPSTVELREDGIHVVDDEDNWHAYEDIEEISETNALIIVQLKNGVAIILPKNKIQQKESLADKLAQAAASKNIIYNKELEWKWK